MIATDVLPLVHEPPVELQVSVVYAASHTDAVPAIGNGKLCTNTFFV